MVYRAKGNEFIYAPANDNLFKSVRNTGIIDYAGFKVATFEEGLSVLVPLGGAGQIKNKSVYWSDLSFNLDKERVYNANFNINSNAQISINNGTYLSGIRQHFNYAGYLTNLSLKMGMRGVVEEDLRVEVYDETNDISLGYTDIPYEDVVGNVNKIINVGFEDIFLNPENDYSFRFYLANLSGWEDNAPSNIYNAIAQISSNMYDISFNNDGTKMYLVNGSSVYQYTLSIPYRIGTATYSKTYNASAQNTDLKGVIFNGDGTKMYIAGSSGNERIFQYSLSTAYDISTATYDSVVLDVNSINSDIFSIRFNNDGSKLYFAGRSTNRRIYQYSLSTEYDISTATYDSVYLEVNSIDTNLSGFTFNNDGSKLYFAGNGAKNVYQFSLSTTYDLSTATYDYVFFNTNAQDTTLRGVEFNPEGTIMYITGNQNKSVYEYTLTTAFDLETASFEGVGYYINIDDTVTKDNTIKDLEYYNTTPINIGANILCPQINSLDYYWEGQVQSDISLDFDIYHSSPASLRWVYTNDGATQYNNNVYRFFGLNKQDWTKRDKIYFYFRSEQALQGNISVYYTNNGTSYLLGVITDEMIDVENFVKVTFDLGEYRDVVENIYFRIDGNQWDTGSYTFYIDDILVYKDLPINEVTDEDGVRIDLIVINRDGDIYVKEGSVTISTEEEPQLPEIPDTEDDELGLALVKVIYGQTDIMNEDIIDIRVPYRDEVD